MSRDSEDRSLSVRVQKLFDATKGQRALSSDQRKTFIKLLIESYPNTSEFNKLRNWADEPRFNDYWLRKLGHAGLKPEIKTKQTSGRSPATIYTARAVRHHYRDNKEGKNDKWREKFYNLGALLGDFDLTTIFVYEEIEKLTQLQLDRKPLDEIAAFYTMYVIQKTIQENPVFGWQLFAYYQLTLGHYQFVAESSTSKALRSYFNVAQAITKSRQALKTQASRNPLHNARYDGKAGPELLSYQRRLDIDQLQKKSISICLDLSWHCDDLLELCYRTNQKHPAAETSLTFK